MSRKRREKRPVTLVMFRHLQPGMIVAGHGQIVSAPVLPDITKPRAAYALLFSGQSLHARGGFDQRFSVYTDTLPDGWREPVPVLNAPGPTDAQMLYGDDATEPEEALR